MSIPLAAYQENRARFAVTRELVEGILSEIQPLAVEALGAHAQRHVLDEGRLPVTSIMTTPASHGGWGEAMPVWFKPYERPLPLYYLDNWALFATCYRAAFGISSPDNHFNIENLARVLLASDLLLPFLPSTQGAGRFLRHGALTLLLGICWLDEPSREAWLDLHRYGAAVLASEINSVSGEGDLDHRLLQIEAEGLLIMEAVRLNNPHQIAAFLADQARSQVYLRLLQGVCLSVTALASHYGTDWRTWIFQAVNVHYRLPGFGLKEILGWLEHPAKMRGQTGHGRSSPPLI